MKKAKIISLISLGLVILILFVLSLLLSPYKYEWDNTIKQIDEDALLVSKFINFAIIFLSLISGIIVITLKKKLVLIYVIIFIYAVVRLMSYYI